MARRFLEGRAERPLADLEAEIVRASGRMDFEYAGLQRDRLERLRGFRDQLVAFRGAVEDLTFIYRVPGFGGDHSDARVRVRRHCRGSDADLHTLKHTGTLRRSCDLPGAPTHQQRVEGRQIRGEINRGLRDDPVVPTVFRRDNPSTLAATEYLSRRVISGYPQDAYPGRRFIRTAVTSSILLRL